MTTMTTAATTRVSLRDVRESAFRALTAHGASDGEARAASRMVLDAELRDGSGLTALLDDLAREPWNRSPVEVAPAPSDPADTSTAVVLGSAASNRLLREAPLALDLLASDPDVGLVAVPCDPTGATVLDTLALDLARAGHTQIAVVVRTGEDSPSGPTAQIRLARPDDSLGTGPLKELPQAWQQVMGRPGILAVRDIDQLGSLSLTWSSPADRAETRARAAAEGLQVDAGDWTDVYTASRRYLVPD